MRVYVAGPLTSGDWYGNVRAAIDAADRVTEVTGFKCFVPHLSLTWELVHHHDHEWWMAWCLEWVSCCQALLRLPGESGGADREVARARELGIPVFTSLEEMMETFVWRQTRYTSLDKAMDAVDSHVGAVLVNLGDAYIVSWTEYVRRTAS